MPSGDLWLIKSQFPSAVNMLEWHSQSNRCKTARVHTLYEPLLKHYMGVLTYGPSSRRSSEKSLHNLDFWVPHRDTQVGSYIKTVGQRHTHMKDTAGETGTGPQYLRNVQNLKNFCDKHKQMWQVQVWEWYGETGSDMVGAQHANRDNKESKRDD
jgi:hypothetical protein